MIERNIAAEVRELAQRATRAHLEVGAQLLEGGGGRRAAGRAGGRGALLGAQAERGGMRPRVRLVPRHHLRLLGVRALHRHHLVEERGVQRVQLRAQIRVLQAQALQTARFGGATAERARARRVSARRLQRAFARRQRVSSLRQTQRRIRRLRLRLRED